MQLNEEQQQAVSILDGPVLVLAGAGSGKTRVVTSRIVHLIKSGIPPWRILGLTFTNKAAQEMQERVRGVTEAHVLISTFHSLGARILRESIEVLGFKSHFAIYDEDDSQKILGNCLDKFGIREKKSDLRIWRSLISKAKNELKAPDEVDVDSLPDSHQAFFPKVYRAYLEQLKQCDAVDFDDLLFLPVQILRDFPEKRALYQERWSHLLIDEYQDTNGAQYTFVQLLVERSQNLFVVGDPDQAIYSWRGANIRNILTFEKDYPGAKVIRLEQNYRSRSNILRAANALIRHNQNRYEKELYSERGEGAMIGRFSGFSDREEARFVASKIRQHHTQEKIPLQEMVVFYRTNAQSRPFEDQFLSMGLPYTIIGGISFYQRKEIKDILSFMRLILSDSDIIAFERVLNIPKRGIGDATLQKLLDAASIENVPLLTYCRALIAKQGVQNPVTLTARAKQGLQEFIQLIEDLRTTSQGALLQNIIKTVIEKTNYLAYLKEDRETYEERKENLDELIAKGVEWDLSHSEPHLASFLEELSLKSSLDDSNAPHDRVNLMTAHNGKGLEFAVAFIVGLEEDLFPHVNSRESPEQLEEERRLCYVGMTRAKEYLYLTDSQMRYLWGTQRFQRPSRFIREIPPEFLERHR